MAFGCMALCDILFSTAASRLGEFQDSERQILSRICCNLLNLPRDSAVTAEELRSMCQSLAERGTWQQTGHLDDEEEEEDSISAVDIREEVASEQGSQAGESSDNSTAAPSSASSHTREFHAPAVKLRVHKTFLELDEEEDSSVDGDMPVLMPLPRPLDFLPQEVCKEKLAAYRADYRRFRVGRAIGARGELHSNCN